MTLTGNRLSVIGDISPDNVGPVRTEGERLIAGQASGETIVIDLSGLGVAHSIVLSLLLCWMRLAASENRSLALEGVGERLQSLAALSGLDEYLPGLTSQS
ncbi:STAS domain-containing protein [Marinobacter halotolerans]|uniref:STAS domain-containing protein n=1 Tax=Marinobacter halotolerans TaxID=1569211 RepID=UPI001CD974F1|nr:STAS domain-containing protein [Marinobacter halotolerans]